MDLERVDYFPETRPEPPELPVRDFVEQGYLQELNRRFLHPLGLALAVYGSDDEGDWYFQGVYDYRDDPEGIRFASLDDEDSRRKAQWVDSQWQERALARLRAFQPVVQP